MRFCSGDAGAVSSLRAVQTSTTAVDDGSERRASSPVRTRSWYRFCHCVSRVPRSCGRYIGPTVLDRKGLPALFRISLWGLISVIGIPLLSGTMPEWGAAQMRTHLPALVGWIMYGASVSMLIQGCDALIARIFGAEKEFTAPAKKAKHVLILGGGFGGMKTAERLEEELSGDPSVAITLVSDTNALLFTPMLAEVAGGSLEPNHISTPLRGSLHRTVVVRGWLKRSVLNCASSKSLAAKSRTTNSYSLWARCR